MATAELLNKIENDGYAIIENFLSDEEVEALRQECQGLIDKMNPAEHQTIFSTEKQNYRDDYFLKSADKIGFFYEDGALDDKGNLLVDKNKSLNKIGHALHVFCPNFKKVTFSEKVQNVYKALKYEDPVVCQSMYIFKQPKMGGSVTSHQDATYLWMENGIKVHGLWMALEDATEENGCLWFIPGSHKGGLYGNYRMVRNPDKQGPTCIHIGDKQEYDDTKFVAAPVKKGSLVIIDGFVVHKSERNTSPKSRHIYTFHVFDQKAGTWAKNNWLQPTESLQFPSLYRYTS